MPEPDLTAEVEEIRELFSRHDELLDRMNALPALSEEFDAAQDEFAAVQDKLAARTPLLLAAIDEVLALTAPPDPLDVLFLGTPRGFKVSKEALRAAITAALTGDEPDHER